MRFPIPRRITLKFAVLYVALMFVGQILVGTETIFVLLTAVYNGLWILAFNTAGGLEYPSGAYILSNGMASVIVGFSAKIMLGQPGERNMLAPILTMACYCVGMLMILIVSFLTRGLRSAQPLISPYGSLRELKQASVICMVVGFGMIGIIMVGGGSGSTSAFVSALAQVAQGFPIMAIVLATTYEIQHSNGKRSINWVTATVLVVLVFFGLVNFGKTAMLLGFVSWAVTAILQNYDFKKTQLAGLALGALFFNYYLSPYSQYVRTLHKPTLTENVATAIEYLSQLDRTRQAYLDTVEAADISEEAHFFDQRVGFLDRYVIVSADDKLINFTEQGHVYGIAPTIGAYANVVPRVIWKNKPVSNVGNDYAHEFGDEVADDDFTTGISFSATSDVFHQAEWLGLLIILPLNLFVCFMIYDSVVGSARQSALALGPIVSLFMAGGEGGAGGPIYLASYGLIGLLSIVWFTKVAGPFVLRRLNFDKGSHPLQVRTSIPVTTPGAGPSV